MADRRSGRRLRERCGRCGVVKGRSDGDRRSLFCRNLARYPLEDLRDWRVSRKTSRSRASFLRTCENVSSGGSGASAMPCAARVVRRFCSSASNELRATHQHQCGMCRKAHAREDLAALLDDDRQGRRRDLRVVDQARLVQGVAPLRTPSRASASRVGATKATRLACLISLSDRSLSMAWKTSIIRTIALARVPVYTARSSEVSHRQEWDAGHDALHHLLVSSASMS